MNNKVLIVDDDTNFLHALRRRLGRRFNVVMARSAEEGLAVVRNDGPFAVVVSDQSMNHMNGIEFLAEVREHTPDTVRMMLTGSTHLADNAATEAGAFRFLTKPCPMEELIRAIQDGVREYWMNAEDGEEEELTDSIGHRPFAI